MDTINQRQATPPLSVSKQIFITFPLLVLAILLGILNFPLLILFDFLLRFDTRLCYIAIFLILEINRTNLKILIVINQITISRHVRFLCVCTIASTLIFFNCNYGVSPKFLEAIFPFLLKYDLWICGCQALAFRVVLAWWL